MRIHHSSMNWFRKTVLDRKISLLLDEIPPSNQSQLNQTYFITIASILSVSGYRNIRSVRKIKIYWQLTIIENKKPQRSDRVYRSIGLPLASDSLSNQLSLFFPLPTQFHPPNFQFISYIARERTYPIIIIFLYFVYLILRSLIYIYDPWFSSVIINFFHCCKFCKCGIIFILFIYLRVYNSIHESR